MTTIAPPTADQVAASAAQPSTVHAAVLPQAAGRTWVRAATIAVLALAAVLYLANLTVSGYANVYYSGAAWAASQSWSAWFFGSVDPANFITVDKPPLATMVTGLSVRLLGLNSAAILLPQALMGVATVAVLMATVRRTFGAPASIIAGLVAALTPAAVLMFRFNNPDALLTLLLVGAAYALVRALESDRFRWLVLAGALVGLGFNTKLLQAYLVLPAFAITFALCAPGSIRRRAAGLGVALVAVVVGSSWWVAAMELIPAASRAYVGGSTNNSALDLVFGYNGLGRIFGGGGMASGGPGAGVGLGTDGGPGAGGFSGTPGILRLFNSQLGGQIAWLLPLSIVGLAAGLLARLRAPRTDLARAGFLMWGLWLAVNGIVFSFMSGVIHSYYLVVMAPAVGALVGGGVVAIWEARERSRWAGAALGVMILGSAVLAWSLLERTPSFAPGLGIAVVAVAGIVLAVLALRHRPDRTRAQAVAVALGLAVLLAGPAAYAVDTIQTAYAGGDPSAGPQVANGDGVRGGIPGMPGVGAAGLDGDQAGGPGTALPDGMGGPPPGGFSGPPIGGMGGPPMGGVPGRPDGNRAGMGAALDTATLDYLVANQGTATWILAVGDASTAAQVELDTGKAVMAMGGFSGGDPALTLEQLQEFVVSGELRFVNAGGGGGGPRARDSDVSSWVTSACTPVSIGGAATTVYDCAGAVGG